MRTVIIVLFVLAAPASMASAVTRCVDAAGKVTFSQHGCPESAVDSGVISAKNTAPSGSGPAVRMNSDIPTQGLGGVRVSGTGHAQEDAPEAAPVPRQENTPIRRAAPRQADPSSCVRWVDKVVRTPRGAVMEKVAVPCR